MSKRSFAIIKSYNVEERDNILCEVYYPEMVYEQRKPCLGKVLEKELLFMNGERENE
jgi:hypothetical protein